jgi:hypothetical protein
METYSLTIQTDTTGAAHTTLSPHTFGVADLGFLAGFMAFAVLIIVARRL